MNIIFDSRKKQYKSIFGSVPTEQEILFRISVGENISYAGLIANGCEFQMQPDYNGFFSVRYTAPSQPQLVFYSFKIITNEQNILFYGNNEQQKGGAGKLYDASPVPYQLTVYDKNKSVPVQYAGSVLYQIFPDRFYREGPVLSPKPDSMLHGGWDDLPFYIKDQDGKIKAWDFYGGNLKGITQKLPYLKELGIDIIYLNPIFEARSNHRYDTADYLKIDPMLGTEEDLAELAQSAKRLGMKIILDGVFNHTGCDSIYFNKFGTYGTSGAYRDVDSPYYPWYTFEQYPDKYTCWWGVDDLPMVDELDPSFLDYIIYDSGSVINKWMGLGVTGWRLDVADELPDEFIQRLKHKCIQNNPDTLLLGEVWEDASNKISYDVRRTYFTQDELDAVTNYPFRNWMLEFLNDRITSQDLFENVMCQFENYPLHHFYLNANMLSSHDIERILTTVKNSTERTMQWLTILIGVQMTFPGMPLVYYGDEAGVEGGVDPDNRRTYPWGHENQDIFQLYKTMIEVHRKHSVFHTGYLKPFFIADDIFGYFRYFKNQKDVFGQTCGTDFAIVLINKNKSDCKRVSLKLPEYAPQSFTGLLDGEPCQNEEGCVFIHLDPLQIKIIFGQ